jgi:hypothetical protein
LANVAGLLKIGSTSLILAVLSIQPLYAPKPKGRTPRNARNAVVLVLFLKQRPTPAAADLSMAKGFKLAELFLPERGRIETDHSVDLNSGSGI